MASGSFYWYDLETTGTDPRWDRIVQFAGLRTDLELNPIGDERSFYVRLADDVLPNPAASLVTGITPQQANAEGVTEWQALTDIAELLSQPGTCTLGYNSLRFDDEFLRYGFYRNLQDPYAREFANGNSRWDLIDLVRATGALRRDGIEWPRDDDDLPVYKLEALSAANGLDHGQAHDALSDVRATVALAQLIRQHQPKLFDYHYSIRRKNKVRALLEPIGARLCVHVTAMYPRARYGCAPISSVCRHPGNSNAIVVADLSEDIEPILSWDEDALYEALFSRDSAQRPPLKEVRLNRCPFVAGIEVLTPENDERLGFDRKLIKERARRLARPAIASKIQRVYGRRRAQLATDHPVTDVDGALYGAFLRDADRHRCQDFRARLGAGEFVTLDYDDSRLPQLAERARARSFPEHMDASAQARWEEHVRTRLGATDVPWLTLAAFRERLAEQRARHPDRQDLLDALAAHGDAVAERYALS